MSRGQGSQSRNEMCTQKQLFLSQMFCKSSNSSLNNINNEYNSPMKLPHVGWNKINEIKSPLFSNIDNNSYLYFVHSYVVKPSENKHVLAQTSYGSHTYCAIVQKDNIIGCQFHPEKSQGSGLQLLKNFIVIHGN